MLKPSTYIHPVGISLSLWKLNLFKIIKVSYYPLFFVQEKLTQVLEAERNTLREFQPLPFHYVEISRLLSDQ